MQFDAPALSRLAPKPLRLIGPADYSILDPLQAEYQAYMRQFVAPGIVVPDLEPEGLELYFIEGPKRAVVGFLFLQVLSNGLVVREMYVQSARQRLGYGTMAVSAVKLMLRTRRLSSVTAEVFRQNRAALRFWARQDFAYSATYTPPHLGESLDVFSWSLPR